MNKRTFIAVSILVMLPLSIVGGTDFVNLSKGAFSGNILIESPQNITYATGNIEVSFVVTSAWGIDVLTYTIDGLKHDLSDEYDGDETAHVKESLSLPDGAHHLTVYVLELWDSNQASSEVYFNMETTPSPSPSPSLSPSPTASPSPTSSPEPQPTEPFPTTLVIVASVIALVVVVAGLLVYFKKRKH